MKTPLKTFENKDTHAKMLGAVMQRGRKKHKNPSYLFRVVRQDNMKLNRTRNRAFKHLESHKQQNPSFVGLAVVHFVHSSRASLHYLRGPGNKFSRISFPVWFWVRGQQHERRAAFILWRQLWLDALGGEV